ncbi:hypothetical protein V6N13_083231 [Hibiscus sabdariffa]
MATVEKMLHIPEDSVPCKIRAKRGCATHPRSIAERERRTRISGKLKKLQELVPNMDKQTSYADMLDLAVQHIKGLQNEVQIHDSHGQENIIAETSLPNPAFWQLLFKFMLTFVLVLMQKLHKEMETCTCGCKQRL